MERDDNNSRNMLNDEVRRKTRIFAMKMIVILRYLLCFPRLSTLKKQITKQEKFISNLRPTLQNKYKMHPTTNICRRLFFPFGRRMKHRRIKKELTNNKGYQELKNKRTILQ